VIVRSRYTDAESGLIYLRARYYDPATAQFLTRDPVNDVTRQPYSYAEDNPLNETDPMGLCGIISCVTDAAKAVGGFVDQHKVGILQGVSGVLAAGAIAATLVTAGTSAALLPTVLSLGASASAVGAQAASNKPDRGARIGVIASLSILTGGVAGAFEAGGTVIGGAAVSAVIAAWSSLFQFPSAEPPRSCAS
jgi:RHS repeat-associated protein